jgi:hypothetical protein
MSLERARSDWKRFSSAGGFEVDLTFETPSGGTSVTVQGIGIKHHLSIDTDGQNVNALNSHISVCEELLVEAGYPTRDSDEIVSLYGHKVSFEDSTGIEKSYFINQSYPDETVGIITCILGEDGTA